MGYNSYDWFMSGFIIGIILFCILAILFANPLNSDTLKDICNNLVGQNATPHVTFSGKLVCEIPSYDHTTNIIVRKAGEK